MTEAWATAEEIAAARARFATAIPGSAWPHAPGMALVPTGERLASEHFRLVSTVGHNLPAADPGAELVARS